MPYLRRQVFVWRPNTQYKLLTFQGFSSEYLRRQLKKAANKCFGAVAHMQSDTITSKKDVGCAVPNVLILSGIAPWTDCSRLTIFLFLFFGEIVCFPVSSVVAASSSFPFPAFLYFTLFFWALIRLPSFILTRFSLGGCDKILVHFSCFIYCVVGYYLISRQRSSTRMYRDGPEWGPSVDTNSALRATFSSGVPLVRSIASSKSSSLPNYFVVLPL